MKKSCKMNFTHYLTNLFWQNAWVKVLVAAAINFLEPVYSKMLWVMVLMLIDLATGIRASAVEGKAFSSSRLRTGLEKCLCYMVALITAYILERYVGGFESNYLFNAVAAFIGVTEITSVYENLNRITGTNIFTKIAEMLKNKVDARDK